MPALQNLSENKYFFLQGSGVCLFSCFVWDFSFERVMQVLCVVQSAAGSGQPVPVPSIRFASSLASPRRVSVLNRVAPVLELLVQRWGVEPLQGQLGPTIRR